MEPYEGTEEIDPRPGEVTRLLLALREGDSDAKGRLYDAVYSELRSLARRYAGPDDTLQPTALVHEAFARLAQQATLPESRSHFLCVAAKAMRRITVDYYRRKISSKRGGQVEHSPICEELQAAAPDCSNLDHVALDEALQALERLSPEQARIAELRIYGGVGVSECATVLGQSTATVGRRWRAAQAFLRSRLA